MDNSFKILSQQRSRCGTGRCRGAVRLWWWLLLVVVLLFSTTVTNGSAAYPQRIVSLGPINTENVYLLGAGDRLVGDTSYCNRPLAAVAKAKVGSVMQISVEKIISLQPDLVLATALSPKLQLAKLEEVGIKVARFGHARSFAQICDHFSWLGKLLGLEARAEELLAEIRGRVEAVRAAVAGLPRQKVFLQIGTMPLNGSIGSSFTNDFIAFSGGINIVEDQRFAKVDIEKVFALNPDVIIIAIMGNETGLAAQERERWQQYPELLAVKQKRVHVIDPDLVCSPSPLTFAEALERIALLIHPQLAENP
jgi:ABC-type Fe3+-hydroxamate transport system substrate-binding protein